MKEIERFCAKVDNLELPLMQAVEKVLGLVADGPKGDAPALGVGY